MDITRLLVKCTLNQQTDCWEWTGSLNKDGYGRICINYIEYLAHRASFLYYIGPIENDKELDHLCRNRKCINPLHLEQVTHRENILRGEAPAAIHARKTACPFGHKFDKKNTRINANGSRHCRECDKLRKRKLYQMKKKNALDHAAALKRAEEEKLKRKVSWVKYRKKQ